jgi:ATP-dependent DNA helicase RecQ
LPAAQASKPLSLDKVPVSDLERAELLEAMSSMFGFDYFRAAQAEIMACVRRGEDVLAVLPTGAGKSLCYQLPAFMDEGGVTLVISPLIALMKDQVDGLPPALQEEAIALNSSLDGGQFIEALEQVAQGKFRLVYAAPERLRQPPFLHAIKHAGLNRLVIDEAHCVSSWGHDFRPDYLWIREAHRDLGAPPLLAMTATAPPLVRQDIEQRLLQGLRTATADNNGAALFRHIAADTYRANLHLVALKARDKDEKIQELLGLVNAMKGSGIVYARSRRDCEQLAEMLRQQGHKAEHYHAGINDRGLVQDRFMSGHTRVIVATIAFGMGVDKADIRFIIHFTLPKSLEAYYQEAGRAGRDGEPAYCVLLHTNGDRNTLSRFANQEALNVEYLRRLYQVVRGTMNGHMGDGGAPVSLDGLAQSLGSDDTAVRVGLNALEQSGLLWRGYDIPWSVTLERRKASGDDSFDRLAASGRLPLGQMVTRNFDELAMQSGLSLSELESKLLAWQRKEWLSYTPNGRQALIRLKKAPNDAPTRVESFISRYNATQQHKVAEITGYGGTHICRHGHLANYLGGTPRERCESCDNCLGEEMIPQDASHLPDLATQKQWILRALEDFGWGRRSLARLLRGDRQSPERAWDSRAFGQLHFRTERAIQRLVDGLLREGLLEEVTLHHGGVVVQLTEKGKYAVEHKKLLAG